jgi:two-component system sensor histidine kinase BaeS
LKGLFARTLGFFLVALLVFLLSTAVVLAVGFRWSLGQWARQRQSELERYAESVLDGTVDPALQPPPADTPLFIFDAATELVFSNRGRGRWLESRNIAEIRAGGRLLGYYATGGGGEGERFTEDSANRRLAESLTIATSLGLPLSFILASGFALLFARRLSTPAMRVASGLDRISAGNLEENIPETGTEEIVHIARAANRLQRQLAGEREIRKQWAQDVAHDLRTPIGALKAQFEGMRDGVLPLTSERIARTYNEIERMEQLVAGLDELARLESPEMRLVAEPVDLADLLRGVAELFAPRAAERGLRIEHKAPPMRLEADPGLLHRALANFTSNAVRHAYPDSVIRLSAVQAAQDVEIAVHNTGDPIPAGERDRLFDRLYRGEYARRSAGSGLGLTIARRIAELHGGSVRVESSADGGTRFVLTLPRGPALSAR